VVPICFVLDSKALYTPIDEKPKGSTPEQLGRVQNIQQHPESTLVVDHYEENWERLFWIQLRGKASIYQSNAENHANIISKLRDKYPQYTDHRLESNPVIKLSIQKVITWGNIEPAHL